MIDARSTSYAGLALLGRAFRERASGTLALGPGSLGLVLRDGHIVAVVFPEEASAPLPPPAPDDSAQLRLERVLAEIGIRTAAAKSARHSQRNLRERMIAGLLDTGGGAAFEPGGRSSGAVEVAGATESLILEAIRRVPDPLEVRHGLGDLDQRLVPSVGLAEERTLTLNEGYILSHADGTATAREVLRQVPLEPGETERTLLGLLLTGRLEYRPAPAAVRPAAAEPEAQRAPRAAAPDAAAPIPGAEAASAGVPVGEGAPPAAAEAPPPEPIADERPAPASDDGPEATADAAGTEGRDDVTPAELAPAAAEAAPDAAAEPAGAPEPTAAPDAVVTAAAATATDEDDAGLATAGAEASAESPTSPPVADASAPQAPGESTPEPPAQASEPARDQLDPAALERRRDVLDFFQSLPSKNHFEVLGVEPGCGDAEVKRAYATLARKYHPDTQRRAGLEDLHDVLEAVFIRIGEAWEVLGDARSRASYEARFPPGQRRSAGPGSSGAPVGPPPPVEPEEPYIPTDEILTQAQILLQQARYWDAIQMLEQRLPHMPPSKQRHRSRILLARAYAKNPNWLRKAEDALQQVVREDPANADAHYELGLLYRSGGMMARAQASFRRAIELRPDHREAAAELGLAPDARPQGGLLKRLFGRGRAS